MADGGDLKAQAEKAGIALTGDETENEIALLLDMAKAEPAQKVLVKATQVGALPVTGLVAEGETFLIEPERFSETWMKPANPVAAKAIKAELSRRKAAKGDAAG